MPRRSLLRKTRKVRKLQVRPRTLRRIVTRNSGFRKAHGNMFVVRKVQELQTVGNGTLGQYIVPSSLSSQQSINLGTPIASSALANVFDVPFVLTFRLSELENFTELTSLFDMYKIVSCKVKVQSTFFSSTQTTTPVPFIDYIQDYDDNTMPSLSLMRQKMGTKSKYFGAKSHITMGVRPKPAQIVYNGTANGYATPARAVWINTTNNDVPHYAIKGVIRNLYLPASANQSPLTWDISYGVALKDVQ